MNATFKILHTNQFSVCISARRATLLLLLLIISCGRDSICLQLWQPRAFHSFNSVGAMPPKIHVSSVRSIFPKIYNTTICYTAAMWNQSVSELSLINHKPLRVKHGVSTQSNIPAAVVSCALSPAMIMEPGSEVLPRQQLLALTPTLPFELVHIQQGASKPLKELRACVCFVTPRCLFTTNNK